ncbi:MAG TPA: 50S ribosomal protein L24 [Thermoplasmata archaeon]|nr:50S ribosomal protein L24 [Thermoplasmata archaeon]
MTSTSPHAPRRQRRSLYTAPTSERRRRMTVLLSRELRRRFQKRNVPVRKGDTVRVLQGSFAGREERVARVSRRDYSVTLDNVTLKTAEEKLKPLALRTAHLVITRLNLADPWRRRALRLREEDVTPEERGELPEGEAAAEPTTAPAEATPPSPAPPVEEADAPAPVADAPPPKARRAPAHKEAP